MEFRNMQEKLEKRFIALGLNVIPYHSATIVVYFFIVEPLLLSFSFFLHIGNFIIEFVSLQPELSVAYNCFYEIYHVGKIFWNKNLDFPLFSP